jgi:lipid II:glycine glycyltransferase (peptidoglycan interpeptide bridge formation enzyme)
MLETDYKLGIFKIKYVWFSDSPFDVKNYSHVRFFSCKQNVRLNGFLKLEETTLCIDLTQDLDQIWKNMSKSSCRYAVNKAIRDGVIVKRNENYEDFIDMTQKFRKKKGLSEYPITVEFIKKNFTLFVAEYEGEIIAGNLFVEDTDYIVWYIGASKRLDVDKEKATLIGNANKLLIWEAIKYSKNKGVKEFDFGIIHHDNKNLSESKKRFGGVETKVYRYEKTYSTLYKCTRIVYQIMPRYLKKRKKNVC